MNDKKERVYSEEDLCEYTILQKIDELEKQLKNIKNEFNGLYETKDEANAIHVKLRQSDAKINNRINTLNEITPTDVGVKDNKLGLMHDKTWLTNQNAINLDGFTYDEATKTLKASGGEGGISIVELTDKSGTIASTQLGEINANPQNFAFKYNGKILLFTSSDSSTYQYCNNTTSSSDNNVMTTSTLLTIESSTGVYTISENVHNVVANSIHPANGGDLTNIQVGSKVYSIPSGGGKIKKYYLSSINAIYIPRGTYKVGSNVVIEVDLNNSVALNKLPDGDPIYCEFSPYNMQTVKEPNENQPAFIVLGPQGYPSKSHHTNVIYRAICIKAGEVTGEEQWNRIYESVVLWYQE